MNIQYYCGLLGALFAERRGEINPKTASVSCSRASKWAPNGPKFLKLPENGPKGPHQ